MGSLPKQVANLPQCPITAGYQIMVWHCRHDGGVGRNTKMQMIRFYLTGDEEVLARLQNPVDPFGVGEKLAVSTCTRGGDIAKPFEGCQLVATSSL